MSTIDEQIQIKLQAKPRKEPKIKADVQLKTIQKKLAKLSELYIEDMISKADYSKKYADLTGFLETQNKRNPAIQKPPD